MRVEVVAIQSNFCDTALCFIGLSQNKEVNNTCYDDNEEDDYHDLDVSKATVIRGEVSLEICKFFPFRFHSNLAFCVVEKCPETNWVN